MSVQEIKIAAQTLQPDEIDELIRFLAERQQQSWERQLEADIDAGKLDFLLEEADADTRAGRVREI